jgi:hypothetical protein
MVKNTLAKNELKTKSDCKKAVVPYGATASFYAV